MFFIRNLGFGGVELVSVGFLFACHCAVLFWTSHSLHEVEPDTEDPTSFPGSLFWIRKKRDPGNKVDWWRRSSEITTMPLIGYCFTWIFPRKQQPIRDNAQISKNTCGNCLENFSCDVTKEMCWSGRSVELTFSVRLATFSHVYMVLIRSWATCGVTKVLSRAFCTALSNATTRAEIRYVTN